MEKRQWRLKAAWAGMVIIGFAVACYLFFQLTYAYHFYFKGQNQLFLMSWPYVTTLFAKPAWAACLAGQFLTQFFYYDYAGAAILTASLTLLLWLAYRAVCLLRVNGWIALAVALALTLREAFCHLYFGYLLESTYALTGGLLMFLLLHRPMQRMKGRWAWLLAIVVPGTLLTYWMSGFGVWLFLLLSAVAAWRVAVPVALAFACLLPTGRSHYNLKYAELCRYPGIGHMRGPAYEREVDMHLMHSYQTGDWDDVVATAEADPLLNTVRNQGQAQVTLSPDERTSASVRLFFYNLVQAQRGQLPDVLLKYYPNYLGTFTTMTQQTPMMMYMNMHEYYWAIGDMSYAERAAFMSCVMVPGNRNANCIKRLAECELVKDEQQPARKYLGLLRQTIPYEAWAAEAPGDGQYRQKARFANRQDSISPNDNSHRIMTQLLRSNPENEVALDYMLCSLLLVKELDNFKRDYDLFCTERAYYKKLYQEAMCIWLYSHQAPEEVWQQYITDQKIVDRLDEYLTEGPAPKFADTYWYYYDVQNPEVY